MFRYIQSSHQKPKLAFQNHIYLKDKCSDGKVLFKCKKFLKFKCRCVHVLNEVIVKIVGDHNHSTTSETLKCNDIINKIKTKAVNSNDTPTQIISTSTTGVSFSTSAQLPSITLLKKSINRKRKINDVLPNPQNNIDLVIPTNLKSYLNEDFCLYDSGPDEHRILVFGTEQNIKQLEQCKYWYVDGTFQSCPSLFYQLFTIHGKYILNYIYIYIFIYKGN